MKQLDVLLVHPAAKEPRRAIYQDLADNAAAIEPPIWAAMLANHCRIRGFGAQILDCEAESLSISEAAAKIKEADARMVCFVVYGQQPSASTQNMTGATKLCDEVKKLSPTIKTLMVGPHISALPSETLNLHHSIDFICQNEGVYTLSNLLSISDFTDFNLLKKVNGLGFRAPDGTAVLNAPEQIVPQDRLSQDLPGMAWDLLPDLSKYRTAGWHSWSNNTSAAPFGALYTSLGCPYKCTFCMINIINRTDPSPGISSADSNKFRFWEPEFMIKQFDYLAEQGVVNVKIADELFVLNPRHFLKICDLLIERDYGFNIWAYSRIDTCKPRYLEKLKQAGVNWLGLGIENPNETLRKEIHKGGFKEIRIFDIIKMIENAGIGVGANYIFGLPMDTIDSMQETLDFAMSNITDMVNLYSAMAYPGSPLHNMARGMNWRLPESYEGYSQHSYHTTPLPNMNLKAEEILKFRDAAWDKYHSNPAYLEFLEKKYGLAARENVESTLKIKLKRKLLGD